MNLIVTSDKENIPSSAFMKLADQNKAVFQKEILINVNKLFDRMEYGNPILSKCILATIIGGVEETEKAKAILP